MLIAVNSHGGSWANINFQWQMLEQSHNYIRYSDNNYLFLLDVKTLMYVMNNDYNEQLVVFLWLLRDTKRFSSQPFEIVQK